MTDVFESSVANLSQSSVRQQRGYSSYLRKFSLFAPSYLIAYGYGTLFLQTAPAPLWFPDSVLLCTLLLTPINEWWLYLAIALPIRFIPTPHPAVPVWFVFATSVNDILKAVVAAYLLRRLPNGSKHPSTMPQLATYFGVALFAVPVFSAFAGAATRYVMGDSFWGAWYRWFLGDAMANVALTPAMLYWSSKHFRARRPHAVELAVWVAGFALSLIAALVLAQSAYSPIAVSVPVPFLIWAATRFGMIGASTSLSVIAILATVRIAEKSTLFSMGLESKSLLFLQIFLFVVSIPVLCIAAVIEEKNSVEKTLRDSERRLRLATEAGRMFAYSWDAATDAIERSGESIEILGVKSDQVATGTAISAMVHPDDKEKLEVALAKLSPGNPELKVTYRIIRPDGSVVWLQRNSRAYFDERARLEGIVGMIADITERKRAKDALAEMTRRLVAAQEQERARIARELHDDINQRLAIFSVELDQLEGSPTEVQHRVQDLRNELRQISDDVQAISHDLHSPKLEYLGAIGGMKSWCQELAERQRIQIAFKSEFPGNPPPDIGLPLFRVLQEAVNNSIKYSGEKRVEVQLFKESGEIHLVVRDSGKGFDVDKALAGKGLGLTSMGERVRLINGMIAIESKPMAGTNIHVRVPLEQWGNTERASA